MIRCFLTATAAFVLSVCARAQCPVTPAPDPPFVRPVPYSANAPHDGFWYGTESLWTFVSTDPNWWRVGEKIVYWRAGFDWRKEPSPALAVVARRLDAVVPLVWAPHASGVRFNDTGLPPGADMAMMTGFAIPAPGCWEIAARYKGQTLSFVVSVGPFSGPATGSEFPR